MSFSKRPVNNIVSKLGLIIAKDGARFLVGENEDEVLIFRKGGETDFNKRPKNKLTLT